MELRIGDNLSASSFQLGLYAQQAVKLSPKVMAVVNAPPVQLRDEGSKCASAPPCERGPEYDLGYGTFVYVHVVILDDARSRVDRLSGA